LLTLIPFFSSFAVDITKKEQHFRYNPSVYLNDAELKEALKKITTAEEMKEFLKARYKTKKDERPPAKRKLERITSNNSRITARPAAEKSPTVLAPKTIEEDEPRPSAQRQQQPEQQQQQEPAPPSTQKNIPPDYYVNKYLENPPYKGKTDQQKLYMAIKESNIGVVKKLLSIKEVDVNAPDPESDNKSPLLMALIKKDDPIVECLLDAGAVASVNNVLPETGETAAMLAAQQGDDLLKEIFAKAALSKTSVDLHAVDKKKQTALMHAAINGHDNNVRLLLEKSANVNAEDVDGRTPLIHAAMQGSDSSIMELLKIEALDINRCDKDGRTALMYAAMQVSYSSIEELLKHGANVNAKDMDKCTALMYAAMQVSYSSSSIEAMLKHGADISCCDKDGRTALMYAAMQWDPESVKSLINQSGDKSAFVSVADNKGWTALMHAAVNGNLAIVSKLNEISGDIELDEVEKEVKKALEEAKKREDSILESRLINVLENLVHQKKKELDASPHEQRRLERKRMLEETDADAGPSKKEVGELVSRYIEEKGKDEDEEMGEKKEAAEEDEDLEKETLQYTDDVNSGDSIPITVDTPAVKSIAKLKEIVNKATVDGIQLTEKDVFPLLSAAPLLPVSTAPPPEPAAGSLFLYNRTATRNYKRDGLGVVNEGYDMFGNDEKTRIAVYHGTASSSRLQRWSYCLTESQPELVLVHYLVNESVPALGAVNKATEDMAEQKNEARELENMKEKSKSGAAGAESAAGEAIPITLDTATVKSTSELTEIVEKATLDAKLLGTSEVHTLLLKASELPLSAAAPERPPAGSLFVYNKTATPHYRKDGYGFGKESSSVLKIDKEPTIKACYGYTAVHSLQRRTYNLIENPQLVIVHYLVPVEKAKLSFTLLDVSAKKAPKIKSQKSEGSEDKSGLSGSSEGTVKAPAKPRFTVPEEETQPFRFNTTLPSNPPPSSLPLQNTEYLRMRALIAIGARLQLSGLELDVFCDAVNNLCDHPPDGFEAASKSGSINYKTLNEASLDLLNVQFDDIKEEMEREWKNAVADHESAALIKNLRDLVINHLRCELVPAEVKTALESAVLDERASMATALGMLRKIKSIPRKDMSKIAKLASVVTNAPLEWSRDQFKLIRSAVIDDDIEYTQYLIDYSLETVPK
jgi:ankyrin repeat protein